MGDISKGVAYTLYTVIRFVWVSAKFGTCTVLRVNGTPVEDKLRRFMGECALFCFNNCFIYTHDGASGKFSTNSYETDNSVGRKKKLSVMTRPESRTLVWIVNFFKYLLCSWFKNNFTRLAMRTEGGRAGTESVPLFPLLSRWIVPLRLQQSHSRPSWLVSVTLQVREPWVPTEKDTFYVTIGIKRKCLF